MLKFDTSYFTKELHLPVVQGVLETKEISFWKRVKRFFSFRRKFEVKENYFLWCEELRAFIFIPKTFVYDGASVPKQLGFLYSSTGVLYLGAGPHDLGFMYGGLLLVDEYTGELYFEEFNQQELDDLFRNLCTAETGMKFATSLARTAVSWGAKGIWNKYRKQNKTPEQDFPHLYLNNGEVN